ncbi:MAG: multidrug efflux RND transporter permease subunit [Mariniblastus sp.]|nr:multidrug efflux RND transporter permease subunit [Mariniblastus sp.]
MKFFIERPIFAAVIALVMVMCGAISAFLLPIAQYPQIVPPQIQVISKYLGAGSENVANSVTTPLEEQINGVEGMIYMSSQSTNNGESIINVTFDVGYDSSIAQVDVQNKVQQAVPQLPSEVNQIGVTVEKQSTNMVLVVQLVSPNGTYDNKFLGNYADIHLTDALARIPGVASIQNFGFQKYAMRIWLDPDKLSNLGLTATDVEHAIQEQNQQVAAGKIGQAPAPPGKTFTYQLNTQGRLDQVEQFEAIILRANSDGSVVRIRDIGRVELGAEEYDWSVKFDGGATGALGIYQLANANALDLFRQVKKEMDRQAKFFPEDMEYQLPYNTTKFVTASVEEVVKTLLIAIGLVFIVVYVFLQSFRSTLIPLLTIPVSLVGTFAFMKMLGFSINTLSLLGMVLAVGLVVDDAIVVVENVKRRLQKGATNIRLATAEAMLEVRGPIIATTISLMAVFIPAALMPGMTGQLYNQFALTIAISVGLSGINSLTLSPALCALFLSPPKKKERKEFVLFRWFNSGFDQLTEGYGWCVKAMWSLWPATVVAFAALTWLGGYLLLELPTGFVPEEDQGYFLVAVALPSGSTIGRTEGVVADCREILMQDEYVEHVVEISGFNGIDSIKQTNAGVLFALLKPWDERNKKPALLSSIMVRAQNKFFEIPDAEIICINAPSIPGLGTVGGFQMEIEDRMSRGYQSLEDMASEVIKIANDDPALQRVFTTFKTDTPQRFIDIDRTKAMSLDVSLEDLFDTLQINLGSKYVNEFNKFGRIYRVYLQADEGSRQTDADITKLKVRNRQGKMIDLSALVTSHPMVGPYNVTHYQMYDSVALTGTPASGYSAGQAADAMEKIAKEHLGQGYSYEWTGVTYQQKLSGNLAPIVFGLSLVLVFFVLAAQYESWSMPMVVLLAVPTGLLGAAYFLHFCERALDIYAQIGLVMLIGLSAKNAILIVEFARERRMSGETASKAGIDAAKVRLRPILMTAFAFILGTIPLAIALGAGANSRRSIGTTVVGGMCAATLFIIFIPVFFIMVESVRERFSRRAREEMTEDREGVEGEDSDKDSPDQQPIPNKVVETSSNDESNGHSKGEPTNE